MTDGCSLTILLRSDQSQSVTQTEITLNVFHVTLTAPRVFWLEIVFKLSIVFKCKFIIMIHNLISAHVKICEGDKEAKVNNNTGDIIMSCQEQVKIIP